MPQLSRSLFEPEVPAGFQYADRFLSAEDEQKLLERIAQIEFTQFEMRGVVARRRVAFFGSSYDAGPVESPAIPEFLLPLRQRLAAWAGRNPEAFAMALINEYPPGAPIGWHRDAPQYDIVAGVSLLSPCHMKFRPYVSRSAAASRVTRRTATHEIVLEPRSAYLITGDARSRYEHHIPAVSALRYSVTFRTLRQGGRAVARTLPE